MVAGSQDDDEAAAAIVGLLGLNDPTQALAVLDMQLRRMTVENVTRVRAERDELRASLDLAGE